MPPPARLVADLFQAYDEDSVVRLVKPVIFEFLRPRIALLRLECNQGIQEYFLDFQGEGEASYLFELLRKHLDENTSVIKNEGSLSLDKISLCHETGSAGKPGSLLSIAFPPGNLIGTLSAMWPTKMLATESRAMQSILQNFAELVGAAIGNLADKRSMRHDATLLAQEAEEASRQFSASIQEHDEAMREKDRIATTDVLTGLLNRRGFFERAEQALKVARRNKMKCLVVFADLDGLKDVNDTLGHDTGDRLLQAAGNVFAASFRESDVVARLGGDEFSAFAIDTAGESEVLARVTDSISRFHKTTTTPYRVSFSIGIIECDLNSPQSLADYLVTADSRMYQQKLGSRH